MYIGRFAPSPTGPLHLGSLIAALGSYLQAHSHKGKWLLRIEDLDPPREEAGATKQIISTLETFGFEWHADIMYQSQRHEAYQDLLDKLKQQELTYACICSRKQLQAQSTTWNFPYPGTCRTRNISMLEEHAIRVLTHNKPIAFEDGIQGHYQQCLETDIGDFILLRKDKLFAYHLAVVADDAAQGVTEIVRGTDLLDSTPRQIHLQQLLNLPTPKYIHLPMAVHPEGSKLSKQTHAKALNTKKPVPEIYLALQFLGQNPPKGLENTNLNEIWGWAKQHWTLEKVPRQNKIIIANQLQIQDQNAHE